MAILTPDRLAPLRAYIKHGWATLTRSLDDILAAAEDPKLHLPPEARRPIYVSQRETKAGVEARLREHLDEAAMGRLAVRTLPADVLSIEDHGLLYLPHPYVVPGGRFNEMYGWDSYFIVVGLLRDGEIDRARNVVDNFLYEIEHYGTIRNANRTYYLSRSHPPFLGLMLRGIHNATGDDAWLAHAMPLFDSHYRFWTSAEHLEPTTGLSRYWDFGDWPAAEVLGDEKDAAGLTHYDRMAQFFQTETFDDYDVSLFYDRAARRLTPLFYRGDRSMRESGFDPSRRFGPGSVDIIHHVPVCLNSLLYQMEQDGAALSRTLGRDAAARDWEARAARRRTTVDRFLWDPNTGLYFDYNFTRGRRRAYEFAATFFPLWVGLASPEQAARVAANLPLFEAPGGVLTSTRRTGNQWDAPFGWAPLQMIGVEGLRRYGFIAAADRLAHAFVSLVLEEFERTGTIVEKYDVVRRRSDVEADLTFGYSENVVGFGWTNGVVLDLLSQLDR